MFGLGINLYGGWGNGYLVGNLFFVFLFIVYVNERLKDKKNEEV